MAANKSASRKLQVLRLEDGEYAKARNGFSLVRAGTKPMAAKRAADLRAKTAVAPMSVSRSNSSKLSSFFVGVCSVAAAQRIASCANGQILCTSVA